ncbi:MAG: S46 family peptidase [Gemmatimonadota bacterium]|nr:MAG: S46 family peptidase [Gemmatimonadota bacterium]
MRYRTRLGRWLPGSLLLLALGCSTAAPPAQEPAPAPAPAAQPVAESAAPAMAGIDTIRAGKFDNGKMWTFEYPPLEYFAEAYGFQPDAAWFEKARLSALRIQGCSASFVSPNGLVATNHHCARGSVTEVSQPGENLLDNGFYAPTLDEERSASQRADQLIEIMDVTAEVQAALEGKTGAALTAAMDSVEEALTARIAEQKGGEEAGIVVQLIELWNGAKYSAYVFRRYNDVRLVAAPELQLGFFGGDSDNFTYPRYALDFSFYRIYDENGEPLKTDNYFKWSTEGVKAGDAIFVIGNPGGSSRLQTVAQLKWRAAYWEKAILDLFRSRANILQDFYNQNPELGEEMGIRNQIFGLRNTEKLFDGRWKGLHNPEYMARRMDTERQFRAALESAPELAAKYGGLIDQMAEIQKQRMQYGPDFGAFLAFGSPNWDAAALSRANLAFRYMTASQGGAPAEALEQLRENFLRIGGQPASLQKEMLAARLRQFEQHLGADSEIGRQILQGRSPEEAADAILAHSVLADSARAADALTTGALTMEDPAVQVVAAINDRMSSYQAAFQQFGQQEAGIANQLGRARFDVYSTTIPPDATFSLRIADGVVRNYEYNGTIAPIYTTFYGLYDHYYSYGPGTEWDLPARWLSPPSSFELSTPLNFVGTSDTIGGNSGSPVINKDLEIVGLVFDGNVEGLPGDYIYDPQVNRSIAVDVRGVLEALDDIYDADRLVLELTTGRLVPTEAEADAATAGR